MDIKSVIRFFSPFSADFKVASKNFKHLEIHKKIGVVFLTSLGGIASCSILGIGAFPTFRWTVKHLKNGKRVEGRNPVAAMAASRKLSPTDKKDESRAWAKEWERNHVAGLANGIFPGDEDVARLLTLQLRPNPSWNEADLSNQSDLKKFYDVLNTERWRKSHNVNIDSDFRSVIQLLYDFIGQRSVIQYIQNADLDRLVALSTWFINEQEFYQGANEEALLHDITHVSFIARANNGLFQHWIERLRTLLT